MKLCYRFCLSLLVCIWSMAAQAEAIQQATLTNGLQVLLIESHNVPMVAMQLVLPAGSRFDTDQRSGTSSMLASMLVDHNQQHDHDALNRWLDEQAIQLAGGVNKDSMYLSLTVLREALPQGLDALSESLLQPAWNQQRYKQLQRDAIAAATKALEEPRYQASLNIGRIIYGAHPYAMRAGGDADSLAHISIQDLQTLYTQQCLPQGSVLAVSGDITLGKLLPLLNSRLKDWKGSPKVPAHRIEKAKERAVSNKEIHMKTTQTLVEFARLGIARSDDDFFPALVLNHYLGGSGFGSVLMEEVREKRGLVYGIYSYLQPLLAQGPFIIALQTRADQANEAVKVVQQQLKKLSNGDINQQRLDMIKGNLTGGFAQRMDSNRERVGLIGMIGFYQLPLDYLQHWTKRVDAVTLADIQRVAARLLPPEGWSIIRVGPVGDKS